MAYKITNNKEHSVVLSNGVVIVPGTSLSVSEIGTLEIQLQRHGIISISRQITDDDKDDAKLVELVNWQSTAPGAGDPPPSTPYIVNALIPHKMEWRLISSGFPDMRAWKLRMRPVNGKTHEFWYKYNTSSEYMTVDPGEIVFADTSFGSLYVCIPHVDGMTMELEIWSK